MPNRDETQKQFGNLRLILVHSGLAMLITLILLMPCAFLVSAGTIPVGGILPLVLLAEAAGVLFGSRGAARRAGKRKLIMGVCVALCVFTFILAMGILFTYPPGGTALVSAAVILLFGVLGGLWGAQKPNKRTGA